MNPRTFLHFLRRHPLLVLLPGIAVVVWLFDAFPTQRMLHWMGIGRIGWELAAIGLVLAGLLFVFLQQYQAKRLVKHWAPAIRVVTSSGEAIRILLTEKKYPRESYWSGTTTDAGGVSHQLVICQLGDSTGIAGHQVTMSWEITSPRELVATQFNEWLRQQASFLTGT